MYDPKSEAQEFVAADLSEALLKASIFFDVKAEELQIRELTGDEASGLAGRMVVVARLPRQADTKRRSSGGADPGPPDSSVTDRTQKLDRGDGPSVRPSVAVEQTNLADVSRAVPEGESKGTPEGELGPLGQFILGVVERLRLGPFHINETEESNLTVYQIKGEAAERISSGEGRAVDALQLIANQAAHRLEDQPKRVVVDIEGDSQVQRGEFLARIASRAAQRARNSGRAVALEAMNPQDRRGIHEALRGEEDVATMSVGEGRYRQVVVVPKGAPEYDEALQYSA